MSREQFDWRRTPPELGRIPADLVAVLVCVAITFVAVFVPGVRETPLRIVVGLPFVVFVPGYALIAALFPEANGEGIKVTDDSSERNLYGVRSAVVGAEGITGLERVVLSFGTSLAIVPLIGLVLNFTPWGIRLMPVAFSVGIFTVIATRIATTRRLELPETERFEVPYEQWAVAAKTGLLEPDTRRDAAVNVVLVVSVLLATASVAYAVAVPRQGESFTEFYLLTENETGSLVADGYPTEFTRGKGRPLHIAIKNHEHRPMNYTVVVELQRVETANNSTRVLDARQLDRFRASVAANETWVANRTIVPTMTGEPLRLRFLLYRGDSAVRPNAYRKLHLWVNVSQPAGQLRNPSFVPEPASSEETVNRRSGT